jgi:DNA adenine methylase
MKPPISYYGGKQRMAHNIIPLIPRHAVYVEPFCGGATMLFGKPWPDVTNTDHYREVINDIDGRLVNFYQQLRDNGEELCRVLELTPYAEREYQLSIREGLNCDDKLEAARRYYVNIMMSFSKKLNGGWGRDVFSRNSGAVWMNKVKRLHDYVERMASVFISCNDALSVIKQWDSPQTFFYCDPPYPGTDCGHYKGYSVDDFKALVKTLDECQGSFILSNYEQEGVAIPCDWKRFEFDSVSSAKGRVGYDRSEKADESKQNRKRIEVVWRRFNRVPVREEIQKLYDSGAFDCFATKPTQSSRQVIQETLFTI